jgi:ABC-type nitrate/sulfonate/bicarbonate transport system substrate-binding protein
MKVVNRAAILMLCLMMFACGRETDRLRIGIIRPSIDHLPFSYAVSKGELSSEELETVDFATGWELGEALAAGKVDAGIVPFSFVWNAVSRGYPVRTVSFLERETDAVIARSKFQDLQMLEGQKIGLLRASSVDLLWRDLARSRGLSYNPVFFRSPNEIIAALRKGEIAAATLYVPLVNKLEPEFKVLHWFGEEHPGHPCCDLAVNTKKLSDKKLRTLKALLKKLTLSAESICADDSELLDFMAAEYGITQAECKEALRHSSFRTGLDVRGKDFQIGMMQLANRVGYLQRVPSALEVYWELDKP